MKRNKKNKQPVRISVRLLFSFLVMVELLVVIGLSWLASEITHHFFKISVDIPSFVWLLIISMILGGAITTFLGQQFFAPMTRLGKAMNQVAQGDFSVRLEATHPLKEIRDIYANFNLMAQELSATEILQTDFVSNVSHEFKTPISAIEGYAMLLQNDGDNSPQERQQYVDKILFNTRRLSKLVHNILLLSKVDHQAILSNQSTFRLDEQIRQTIVLMEPEWDCKQLEFDADLDNVLYTSNEGMLTHVWSNLLSNAIKFSPEAGTIRMSLKQTPSELIFTIEDEGPGVDETIKRHLFDKFYQGDSSHKSEGNGLGLALVKEILAACHGTIEVENVSPHGCRFIVRLSQ